MENDIFNIIKDSLDAGLPEKEVVAAAPTQRKLDLKLQKTPFNYRKFSVILLVISVLYALKNPTSYRQPGVHLQDIKEAYLVTSKSECIIEKDSSTHEAFRAVSKCSMCENVTEVPVIYNLTREYFLQHHAYTGVPVLVKGYAKKWSALNVFSYEYFRKIYTKPKIKELTTDCQFFPYKTNFVTFDQIFKMSKKRANLKKDQWYVGWNNCVPSVMKIFRKHYKRPDFLPSDSETSQVDWIFMGGSGYGAGIHIDSVNRPSWQAQIAGKKTWTLEPIPECEHVCKRHLDATMEVGDIIVVDTNLWYHGTYVHPGNMSITVGAEFD